MNSYSADCGIIFPNFKMKMIKEERENQGWVYNMRVNISSKEDALKWLEEFSENTNTTYRVRNTFVENTAKIVFKKEYRCIHNTRPGTHKVKKPTSRHTGCNAKITITVKQQNMKRSKDIYLQEYPTEIYLKYTHNHPIIVADPLGHRTPSESDEWFAEADFPSSNSSNSPNINKSEVAATSDIASSNNVEFPQINSNELNGIDVNEGCQMIQEVSDLLRDKLMKNPQLYFSAIKKFHELATNSAKTDSHLMWGLCTFGKYTGIGHFLILKKKNLQDGNQIGVQPTAISHKKTKIHGRSLSNSDRPPKRQRLEVLK